MTDDEMVAKFLASAIHDERSLFAGKTYLGDVSVDDSIADGTTVEFGGFLERDGEKVRFNASLQVIYVAEEGDF